MASCIGSDATHVRHGVARCGGWLRAALSLGALLVSTTPAQADVLRVMRTGLGSGTIVEDATPSRISCGSDCDETFGAVSVTLRATAGPGSTFAGWGGDCSGTAATCTVDMSVARSVRASFDLSTPIPLLADFSPGGIDAYLTMNPQVNSPARFLRALPAEFKQNWILMSRSESLQTGTAEFPRILLPSATADRVFTIGLATHSSYPGAHPDAVEYMQFDAGQRNFRFHEVVLNAIGPMNPRRGTSPPVFRIPARSRGVEPDDAKCFACHSTRNVLNRGTTPGTDGITPGTVPAKSKPNWDAYDSWGGMVPFNRDRIYKGSLEAAAFRRLLNLWTWRGNDAARAVIEQLELQPPMPPAEHTITRINGGANDGHITFGFDDAPPPVRRGRPAPDQRSRAASQTAGAGRVAAEGRGATRGWQAGAVPRHARSAPHRVPLQAPGRLPPAWRAEGNSVDG
jgi:hypothetical protein